MHKKSLLKMEDALAVLFTFLGQCNQGSIVQQKLGL